LLSFSFGWLPNCTAVLCLSLAKRVIESIKGVHTYDSFTGNKKAGRENYGELERKIKKKKGKFRVENCKLTKRVFYD
jgi:hypothetical protein